MSGVSNPAGPVGPPPNWGPQQPWAGEAKRGGPPKWVFGVVALVAAVAVIVGATVFFSHDAADAPSASSSGQVRPSASSAAAGSTANPKVASANDAGPVGLITDEPTCAAWTPIADALTAAEQNGWSQRNPAIPAAAWTPAQRASYEAVAAAMRTAADQIAPLATQTPHRVVRELYEQTIAYQRAYADSIPAYVPANDSLALVTVSSGLALTSICEAIANGAAPARAALVPEAAAPTASTASVGEPTTFFVAPPDPVCAQWHSLVAKYTGEFAAWRATDPNVPAAQWSPAQRRINDAVAPEMVAFADDAEALATGTANGVFQDFAVLAAQYRRAFAAALPTYTPADALLTRTASAATGAIDEACTATEG